MTDDLKQDPPVSFRAYPPIKKILDKLGKKNKGYFINSAIAAMGGVSQAEVDEHARGIKK